MSPRCFSWLAIHPGVRYRLAGKTLFELLVVVVAIIAVMLGLFLPVVHMVWHAVDRLK